MRCEEARRYVSPYLDSELDAKTSFDIARHLEQCESCRARFESEKTLEAGLVGALKEPVEEDEAILERSLRALPRRRWARWLFPPVAAGLAAGLVWVLVSRSDLPEYLARDYRKVASGRVSFDLESSDPAAIERFFGEKMGLSVRPPTVAGATLKGGRKCSLRGTPAAFTIYEEGTERISVAVFDGAHLDRFPSDRARVQEGPIRARDGDLNIIVCRSGWKIVCVCGTVGFDRLEAICKAWE
jgi:anti-sigma factor RsiW